MEAWHLWAIFALIMIVVEIFTLGFAAICPAIGAAAAAVTSAATDSLAWQTGIFALFTLLSFLFVRPFINRALMRRKNVPKSGVEALIGREAMVEVTINPDTGTGRVTIDGDSWKAVSNDGNTIEKGEKVEVLKVDSIILTVRKANSKI